MTPEEHNKTLATLYFVYAGIHGLTLIALLLLAFAVQSATGNLLSSFWMMISLVVFLVLLFVVGIWPLLVGFGFRKRRSWVKVVGIPLAVVSMANIPIGTALGIYTIKFLRSPGGAKLYGGKASNETDHDLQEAM
ncbi:MAG TPA: hypothetical protein VJT71_05950, partial [Pyrinomonadaceae bacterium]|nr:hypothetical protein [Pyrinomonadaceae bacterium]